MRAAPYESPQEFPPGSVPEVPEVPDVYDMYSEKDIETPLASRKTEEMVAVPRPFARLTREQLHTALAACDTALEELIRESFAHEGVIADPEKRTALFQEKMDIFAELRRRKADKATRPGVLPDTGKRPVIARTDTVEVPRVSAKEEYNENETELLILQQRIADKDKTLTRTDRIRALALSYLTEEGSLLSPTEAQRFAELSYRNLVGDIPLTEAEDDEFHQLLDKKIGGRTDVTLH